MSCKLSQYVVFIRRLKEKSFLRFLLWLPTRPCIESLTVYGDSNEQEFGSPVCLPYTTAMGYPKAVWKANESLRVALALP